MNMSQHAHDFTIQLNGLDKAELVGKTQLTLNNGEVGSLPLSIKVSAWELVKSRTDVEFKVIRDDGLEVTKESRFIGPAGR